jgi:hypothetical protein
VSSSNNLKGGKTPMFLEKNVSSNADMLVAILLVVTILVALV